MKELRRAVFLDRDGTINEEVGYVNHPDRFKIIPGVVKAIKILNEMGFLVIVVTNQGGVAKGFFDEKFLNKLHNKLIKELKRKGAKIDAIYYCPHHPHGKVKEYSIVCNCRKPATGLIEKACEDFNIDMENSYLVGDQKRDIEFGKKLKLKTILVKTGYGKGELFFKKFDNDTKPDYVSENLLEAVRWIRKNEKLVKRL